MDPLDIGARLDDLRVLKDGWLDGAGIALPSAGLDWLTGAFEELYPDDVPLPYLYPTESGGVRAEWSLEGFEVSLEIDLSGKVGEWDSLGSIQTPTNLDASSFQRRRNGLGSRVHCTMQGGSVNEATHLHRQVHPSWVQDGRATSQAFKPTPKDNGRLSVYDGDQMVAEKA